MLSLQPGFRTGSSFAPYAGDIIRPPRPSASAAGGTQGDLKIVRPKGAEQPRTEIVGCDELDAHTVVVNVHASALNYPDLSMMTGIYQTRPPTPFTIGNEGAGEVMCVAPIVPLPSMHSSSSALGFLVCVGTLRRAAQLGWFGGVVRQRRARF